MFRSQQVVGSSQAGGSIFRSLQARTALHRLQKSLEGSFTCCGRLFVLVMGWRWETRLIPVP